MDLTPPQINYWPRASYIEQVKPFIGNNIIKVFTGQRRVGKSFLMLQVIDYIRGIDAKAHFLYINKEDLKFDPVKNEHDLNNLIIDRKAKSGKTYVFIDEIQDIEHFEKALRSLNLDPSLDLYCTGSNAQLMSGDIAGLLSGKFIEFNIYSLSYLEFLQFHQLDDIEVSLGKYLKYGGLPYLANLTLDDNIVFEYIKSVYTTVVYRDVINRYNLRNSDFLEKLVKFLADYTGSIFSANRISLFLKAQKIKISPTQVQTYLDYLVNACLVHRVSRYDIVGKRLFESGEKFYFGDTGIRNGIWGYRPEDMSKILENAVHNHLLFCGYSVKVGNLNKLEIDFVAEKGGEKIYVQAALMLLEQKTIEREVGNLMNIPDNYPKYLITLDNFSGNTTSGIRHLSLREFLKGEPSY